MAELLTRQIVYEYQKRLKALPEYGNQDIKERRELRIELQNRCGITEFNDKYGNQDNQGMGKVRRRA